MQLIQTTSNATLTERHVQQLSWLDRRLDSRSTHPIPRAREGIVAALREALAD
jgi:hypothetical protein